MHKYYVLITSQFENHPRLKIRFTPRPEEMRKSVACHLMGGGIGRRRIIKALQSYRTNSVNAFAYSTPNLPVQPNSWRLSSRGPSTYWAKQMTRAPPTPRSKIILPAEIKPASKERVTTQTWISCFFLFLWPNEAGERVNTAYTHTLPHSPAWLLWERREW